MNTEKTEKKKVNRINRKKQMIGIWVDPKIYKEFKKILIDKNYSISVFFRNYMLNYVKNEELRKKFKI